MRISLSMLLLLSASLPVMAQNDADTMKTRALDEVVVEGVMHYAVSDGVAYIPTKSVKRHAIDVNDMLMRMMVAGLRVDAISGEVKTTYGNDVTFFIDGVEADGTDVKALRPKDVLRVEFLQSPADPKYKGRRAVVDIAVRKYAYGGYVLAEGNQSFMYNTGDYGAVMKLNHGKWTYQALLEGAYENYDDLVTRQDIDYVFAPGNTVSKHSDNLGAQRNSVYTSAFTARYATDKFIMRLAAGYMFDYKPADDMQTDITYTAGGTAAEEHAVTRAASRSAMPYANAYFQWSKLPHGAMLYGEASLSYNHNNASSTYTLDTPLLNASKEDVWLPRLWMSYAFPLYRKNYLTVSADWYSEFYRTRYYGTDNSRQKLTNTYFTLSASYNHKISDQWSANVSLKMPVNSYMVNDGKSRTTPYINGYLTVNGSIGSKHSLYALFGIQQMEITPSYYNTVVRRDNEIEGTKGNADLRPQRYMTGVMTYTWMPANIFSLNATLRWEMIKDDIVPYWHPADGMMIKEIVNGGDYNVVSLSVTPSLSLLGGRLNINPMLYYAHEMHDGVRNLPTNNFGLYPYVGYDINKHFSVSAYYKNSFGKGYMRGGNSTVAESSDALKLTAQYTSGNLHASLSVYSVLRKTGWWKSRFDSDTYHLFEYRAAPKDGRYVSLTVRYTLDFGRETKHGNELRYEGQSKTSVLQ